MSVVVLVVALAAASTVAVVQSSRLSDSRERVADLSQQAADDSAQLDDLRRALEEQRALEQQQEQGNTPLDDLEDLLGQDPFDPSAPDPGELDPGELDPGELQDLLEEQGLGDLLGEGLEDLLGGIGGGPDVGACVTGVQDGPDIDADTVEGQFEQTAAAVERLRGQTFPDPITPTILTEEEIAEVFAGEVARSYPEDAADQDERILTSLQVVPADVDLVQTQVDLLSAQVAGYYDAETGELVVRADDPEAMLGPVGLIALAHELQHALDDVTLGLPELDAFGPDEDGAVAALAVVEGSAVAVQTQFQISSINPLALLTDPDALAAGQGLEDVPYFIAQSLTFPYLAGPSYICGVYGAGGWDAVEEQIADPPATTHEVMFPGLAEDYIGVPAVAGPEGFDLASTRTFGAAPLSWLLGAPGGNESAGLDDPVGSTQSWRGGELSLWTQGQDSAVAMVFVGEDLCGPLSEWWSLSTNGGTAVREGSETLAKSTLNGTWGVVSCDGEDVRVGIAPTVEQARESIAS